MSADRTAPLAGYDTAAKAAYRKAVWDVLQSVLPDIGDGRILIMPSSEGLEIDEALDRGARAENLICVDRSAAVIATSKWRRRHPNVEFFAEEISEAHNKLSARGIVLRAANLDLCGKFSDQTISQVGSFMRHAPRYSDFVLGLTVAKGREGSALCALLRHNRKENSGIREPRIAALIQMADIAEVGVGERFQVTALAEGSYVSGRHPMAWAALRVRAGADIVSVDCALLIENIKAVASLISEGGVGQARLVASAIADEERRLGFFSETLPDDWPWSARWHFVERVKRIVRGHEKTFAELMSQARHPERLAA